MKTVGNMTEPGTDEEEIEIPIWIGGCEKWLTGLTRRTTCDDVIYALLAHHRNPNRGRDWDVQNYAVFEGWKGVERALSGRTKILKVWRTWGSDIRNVKFCLRKVDNILDTSSEISRTRRHRKPSRTKEKEKSKDRKPRDKSRESKHKHKDKDSHRLKPDHKYEKDNERPRHSRPRKGERSKVFHQLVQMVIEQERRIRDQLSKIQELDSQIGKFESKMKEAEAEKQSKDRDAKDESSDGLFPKVKSHDMEAYLHMCDSILELEESICKEQDKIEDLSVCIQEESTLECDDSLDAATAGEYSISTGQCTFSLPSGVQHKQANEVGVLRTELQRSISLSMAQQKQMQLVNRTLGECEKQLTKKKEYINRLFVQLDTIEEESEEDVYNDSGNVDSPPYSVDNKDGRDSCDSGVQGDMLPDADSVNNTRTMTSHPVRATTSLPFVVASYRTDSYREVELNTANLPRLRRHMVPYKTYTASYNSQPDQYGGPCPKSTPSDDSDTGLSSLHSDEPLPILETLV